MIEESVSFWIYVVLMMHLEEARGGMEERTTLNKHEEEGKMDRSLVFTVTRIIP